MLKLFQSMTALSLCCVTVVCVAVGVAIAMPLTAQVSGTSIPEAQAYLDLFPARVLAIAANSVGTLAAPEILRAPHAERARFIEAIVAGVANTAIIPDLVA